MKAFLSGLPSLWEAGHVSLGYRGTWMKSGPALGDKGPGVASGQGAWMRRGSDQAGGGLGESVLVPNQQEGPSSSRITFQPSCLDRT